MVNFVLGIILVSVVLYLCGWEWLSIKRNGISSDADMFTSSPFIALYIGLGIELICCIIAVVINNPVEKAFQEWVEKFMRQTEPRRQNIKG